MGAGHPGPAGHGGTDSALKSLEQGVQGGWETHWGTRPILGLLPPSSPLWA